MSLADRIRDMSDEELAEFLVWELPDESVTENIKNDLAKNLDLVSLDIAIKIIDKHLGKDKNEQNIRIQ